MMRIPTLKMWIQLHTTAYNHGKHCLKWDLIIFYMVISWGFSNNSARDFRNIWISPTKIHGGMDICRDPMGYTW
jgi:hypothetical protein